MAATSPTPDDVVGPPAPDLDRLLDEALAGPPPGYTPAQEAALDDAFGA